MKLGALFTVVKALIDFIRWTSGTLRIAFIGKKKREVKKAIAEAKKAKSKDEKIAAAKKMESAFNLRARGSKPGKPRR